MTECELAILRVKCKETVGGDPIPLSLRPTILCLEAVFKWIAGKLTDAEAKQAGGMVLVRCPPTLEGLVYLWLMVLLFPPVNKYRDSLTFNCFLMNGTVIARGAFYQLHH